MTPQSDACPDCRQYHCHCWDGGEWRQCPTGYLLSVQRSIAVAVLYRAWRRGQIAVVTVRALWWALMLRIRA